MSTLSSFKKLTDQFETTDHKLPVLFIGHGSPMNGIEDNEFSRSWKTLGQKYQPRAILCISAHWLTRGTQVTAMPNPQTIHDFGGFPRELFDVQYSAPGDPTLADETTRLITKTKASLNYDWGLDHGTWSILKNMYPGADIPVIQLSIDYSRGGEYHYELASELAALRKKGVLIIGSGNMVHNLGMIAWDKAGQPGYGYDWAVQMNETFKRDILAGNHSALIDYEKYGNEGRLSIPTPDHYYPLLYILGLKEKNEQVSFFNDRLLMGSLSMTSVTIETS